MPDRGPARNRAGGATQTWGSASFVPSENALVLSSSYSDSMIDFQNAIILGGLQRIVRVADGSASVDARLSGVLSSGLTGGLVKEGSISREADGVTIRFIVTDTAKDITVNYKGILPDLFKEGKGVVAQGKMTETGTFSASEVLAKHDENYMPPEAAKAVDDAQKAANKHVSPSSVSQPKASY